MITHAAHRKQYTVLLDRSRKDVLFILGATAPRFEKLNAARMSAAREGLTERNIYLFFSPKRRKDAVKSGRYLL